MKNMKQILTLVFLMVSVPMVFAQQNTDCTIKYNLFKGDYQAKKYDTAYENWIWCMDNCPKLSVNIYKLGVKIAQNRIDKASEADKPAAIELMNRIYTQRMEHFPKDFGKVYNDWATFKASQGATDEEVFDLLEKSFKADPTDMSGKNIFKYFDVIMQRNKDTNPQVVFDTYDEVTEGLELKRADYSKKIDKYNFICEFKRQFYFMRRK